MNIKTVFIFLIFLSFKTVTAQTTRIDSLKTALKSALDDSLRVHLLLQMALVSAKYSQEEELKYTQQAQGLAQKIKYKKGIAMAFDHLGVINRNQSDYHLSLKNHNLALKYINSYGACRERAIILNNIGVVYRRLDELSKAAEFHLRALSIAEELGDNRSICISTNSLGNIYLSQGNLNEALHNFSKALDEEKKLNNKLGQAINLNNIGYVYAEKKEFQKAIDFFTQSLKMNESIGNEKGKAICYNSIGEIYYKLKKPEKAIEMYRMSLNINTKIGDLIYTSASLINIGEILTSEGKFDEAETNLKGGLAMAFKIGSKIQIERAYARLSDLYLKKAMYPEALQAFRDSRAFRDSILNEKNNATIARLKTIYETERQEKEIQSNKLELANRNKQLLKEKALKLFFIFGFATMILVSLLLYRNYLLKKKANVVLLNYNRDMDEKNRILMMQKEEILSQRDMIEDKSRVVNKAYELIKNKNKNIIENIRYAFQIQNALLPPLKTIRSYLPESFIVYKPRDIVSGDFYWVAKKNNLLIAASADCTGHGVSGAFMSILGISALNEIVNDRDITRPDLIMNQLREKIITSLQQKDKFWEARDGIDMAILTFDFSERKVLFSGANSQVILIRNEELIQLKGDKMPVSIFPEIVPFSYDEHILLPNDMFYLFTDGYYHQFGGMYGKKFNIRHFTSLLHNVHKLNPEEQLNRLEETFRKWRGRNEQVDDILVMGIKITENMLA